MKGNLLLKTRAFVADEKLSHFCDLCFFCDNAVVPEDNDYVLVKADICDRLVRGEACAWRGRRLPPLSDRVVRTMLLEA
jgi:hypothetical protein